MGTKVDLTVIDEAGTRTEQVSVPDAVAAGRVAVRLVQLLGLPGTGADGLPLAYSFLHERTGRQIGGEETLSQAGVSEHDVLRLVALPPAHAREHGLMPKPPSGEVSQTHAVPAQVPPETAVISPLPPQSSRQSEVVDGRWSPSMAIAVIALAVALMGVAAAIAVSRGGKGNTHVLVTDAGTGAVASPGSAETPSDGGEQTTGERGEGTTTTNGGEGLLPAVSTQQMESEIQEMLRNWHEDVVRGDYHAAWELLSQRKQAQQEREQGYAKWEKNQSTLRPYLNPAGLQVSIQSTEPSSGVAQLDVTGMTWNRPGASCSEWSGITWVKYEDGEWRYDPGYSTTSQRERKWKSHYSELLGGSC
jgi:hypothetical protein